MRARDDGYKAKGEEIGARIALARSEAGGMTQEELGMLIGVTPRSVQAYEAGDVIPYRYLRDMERALGRPVAWFLHGEAAMQARDGQLEEIQEELRAVSKKLDDLIRHVASQGRSDSS